MIVLEQPGAYDDEEAAAHTYDLAALKYWGTETILNFPVRLHFHLYDFRVLLHYFLLLDIKHKCHDCIAIPS